MSKNSKNVGINFDASLDINNIKTAVIQMQKSLDGISLPQNITKGLVGNLDKLNIEIKNFEALSSKMTGLGDVDKSNKSLQKIAELFSRVSVEIKDIKGLDPNKLIPADIINKINKVVDATNEYNEKVAATEKATKEAGKQIEELIELKKKDAAITKRLKELDVEQERAVASKIQNKIEARSVSDTLKSFKGRDINSLSVDEKALFDEMTESATRLRVESAELTVIIRNNTAEIAKLNKESEKNKEQQKALSNISEKYGKNIKNLSESLAKLGKEAKADAFTKLKETLGKIEGINIDDLKSDLTNIDDIIRNLSNEAIEEVNKILEELQKNAEKAGHSTGNVSDALDKTKDSAESIANASAEVERLKNSLVAFFSIGNAVQLFKRAIKSAFDVIKELDEVMTQTAVVTDFKVGDMWKQLPEYTKRANELGVSVKGAYEAATLYYQQGLSTNEVISVSNETLKMAKIAGLEYAEATDYMTAALRGFNMEINEQSAQKINDVYSKLAAITAANTQEISIAMTKAASIAKSSNMEFETTASFLAQIIETTREAPETAGTALKTVIARFQELKKDPASIGEIDGEIVDANAIEGALRNINVPLREINGQFRDLDDVFIEIAEKWSGLDKNTQRYIATIAAGSRQQSRFLAMMSDYTRTIELIDAAHSSAGSGQVQFEKTLDSLNTSIERLQNAWNEFTMGIANSTVIKGSITVLTKLIEVINSITSGFGELGGAVTKILLAFAGFKAGKQLLGGNFLKSLLGGTLGSDMEGQGAAMIGKFANGWRKGIKSFERKGFKKSFSDLFKSVEPSKFILGKSDFSGIFNGLDVAQQEALQSNIVFKEEFINNLQGIEDKGAISDIWDANGISAATDEVKKLGGEVITTQKMIDESTTKGALSFGKISAAVGATGLLVQLLANQMKNWGVDEKAVKSVQALGIALMALPVIFKVIETVGVAAGLGVQASFGWISAIIAGVVFLGGVAAALIDTSAEKAEKAAKRLKDTEEALKSAKTASDDLLSSFKQYSEIQDTLDALTVGTAEWKTELNKANEQVLELLDNYPELTKGMKIVDGRIMLDLEVMTEFATKKEQQVETNRALLFAEQFEQDKEKSSEYAERLSAGNLSDDTIKYINEQLEQNKEKSSNSAKSLLLGNLSDDTIQYKHINELSDFFGESFNSEEYTKEVEKRASVLQFATTDTLKEMYFNLTGQESEGISRKDLREKIAKIFAIKKNIESFDDFILGMKNLSEDKQINLTALLTGDASNLTLGQLDSLAKDSIDYNDYGYSSGEDMAAALRISGEELRANIKESKEHLSETYENLVGDLNKKGISQKLYKDSSIRVVQSLAAQTSTLSKEGAKDYIEKWNDLVSKSNLTKDKEDILKNYLTGVNWSDLVSAKAAMNYMQQMGLDDSKIKEYWLVATEAANSYYSSVESAAAQTKNFQDNIIKLNEAIQRLIAGTGTEEDLELLDNHGIDLKGKVEFSIEGLKIDNDFAKELSEKIKKDLALQADMLVLTTKSSIKNAQEIVNSVGDDSFSVEGDELDILGGKIGLERGFNEIDQGYRKRLRLIYDEYVDIIDSSEAVIEETIKAQDLANAEAYTAIQNMARGASEAAIIGSAHREAKEAGADLANIEEYEKYLISVKGLSKVAAAVITSENIKVKKGIEEITSSYEEWQGLIDENSGLMVASTTEEISQYNSLKNSLATILNLSDGLSDKFLENAENVRLIGEAANGSSLAIMQLRKNAGFEFLRDLLPNHVFGGLSSKLNFDNLNFGDLLDSPGTKALLEVIDTMVRVRKASEETISNFLSLYGLVGERDENGEVVGFRYTGLGATKITKTPYENKQDIYYNLVQRLAAEERKQKEIAEEYNRLLNSRLSTGKELAALNKQEIDSLEKQLTQQNELLGKRRQELQDTLNKNNNFGKYAWVDQATMTVQINASLFDSITDADFGREVEVYKNDLERIVKEILGLQSGILKTKDEIVKQSRVGLSGYQDLENRLVDALEKEEQSIVDALSKTNEAINKASSNLIDSLQKNVDKMRRDRENDKTEKDLTEKERRLAYLRQDTSGANLMEIKQLEKEINEGREEYTDSLVDQAIQNLQEQSDVAEEQRDRQIEIANSQLKELKANGVLNAQVAQIIKDGIGENGLLNEKSELYKLLSKSEESDRMSSITRELWMESLSKSIKEAYGFSATQNSTDFMQEMINEFERNNGKITQSIIDLNDKRNFKIGTMGRSESKLTNEQLLATLSSKITSQPTVTPAPPAASFIDHVVKKDETLWGISQRYGVTVNEIVEDNAISNRDLIYPGQKLKIKRYIKGGLVTETGPAWLDGTPSDPELILKARDTENFIQLKNILANIAEAPLAGSGSSENHFEINVQVDSLANDYDVEQMINKVKETIYRDSAYRNVNTVNLLR